MINNYKNLLVWKKSIELVVSVYQFTKKLPASERYGLVSQLERASVSIPSNIVEGSCRSSKKDFAHFLEIALGSTSELDTQLEVALQVNLASKEVVVNLQNKAVEISKMLQSLIKTCRI
ncbi:MAG: hypothetical protein RLZZ347_845 [Candidatus Parcubacteria bacterium]|jgi:four helix bundle protein